MGTRGLLFDLDGVIVDTAKFHFLAWRELAEELGIPFTENDNERLKGVSRIRSFEIILEIGYRTMTKKEKEEYCARKNKKYVNYIKTLSKQDILPGVEAFLQEAKNKGYKTGLCSASKNAAAILKNLNITEYFDVIIDGNMVSRTKPDPEVYLKGASELNVNPTECIVFEDALAGIEAAHNAGMKAVGIGDRMGLSDAEIIIPGFEKNSISCIEHILWSENV